MFGEVEPGTEVRPQTELPDPAGGLNDAGTFGAFLDAARWGTSASADPSAFQAGTEIEDYQLLPLVKAPDTPRVPQPRLVVSLDWVKFDAQMRWFDEFLPADSNIYPRAFDLLIVDEAHQIAPAAVGRYARDSPRTRALRRLAPHFEHRLFLTATPHNGYRESFESLLETLDPNRFAKGVEPSDRERALHALMLDHDWGDLAQRTSQFCRSTSATRASTSVSQPSSSCALGGSS